MRYFPALMTSPSQYGRAPSVTSVNISRRIVTIAVRIARASKGLIFIAGILPCFAGTD